MNRELRSPVMVGGASWRQNGNSNPQITQITQKRLDKKSATTSQPAVDGWRLSRLAYYLSNLRNLRIDFRTAPQIQDRASANSRDRLSHSASSTHKQVQGASGACNLSHSQT